MAHEEKPIPAPGHVAAHFAVSRYVDCNVGSAAITCDIVDRDLAAFVQNCADCSHRGFYFVFARFYAVHVCQSCHQADGAVTAHAEVADVIKEDDGGGAGGIDRVSEQSAHHDVGTAGLIHHSGTKIVVISAKTFQAIGERTRAKVRAAAHYQSGGLAPGVGVDHSNSMAFSSHVS